MSWRGKTWRPMTEEGAREADWTPKAVSDEYWMTLPVSEFEELSRKARMLYRVRPFIVAHPALVAEVDALLSAPPVPEEQQ